MKTIQNTKSPNSLIEAVLYLDCDKEKCLHYPEGKLYIQGVDGLMGYEYQDCYHVPAITEEVARSMGYDGWGNPTPLAFEEFRQELSQFLTDHGYTLRDGSEPPENVIGVDGPFMTNEEYIEVSEAWETALDPNGLVIKLKP